MCVCVCEVYDCLTNCKTMDTYSLQLFVGNIFSSI